MYTITQKDFEEQMQIVLGTLDYGLIMHYVARGLEYVAVKSERKGNTGLAQVRKERADILYQFLEDNDWYDL